jgi:hypothetical protein
MEPVLYGRRYPAGGIRLAGALIATALWFVVLCRHDYPARAHNWRAFCRSSRDRVRGRRGSRADRRVRSLWIVGACAIGRQRVALDQPTGLARRSAETRRPKERSERGRDAGRIPYGRRAHLRRQFLSCLLLRRSKPLRRSGDCLPVSVPQRRRGAVFVSLWRHHRPGEVRDRRAIRRFAQRGPISANLRSELLLSW